MAGKFLSRGLFLASSARRFGLSTLRKADESALTTITLGKYDHLEDSVKLAPGVFTTMKPPVAETVDEAEARYYAFFAHPELTGWMLRKGINDMIGHDFIPEPPTIINVLKQCRKQDDHSLAVRFLEAVRFKCGPELGKIWPYVIQEIGATLKELGVSTPEELGYDKPELWCPDAEDL